MSTVIEVAQQPNDPFASTLQDLEAGSIALQNLRRDVQSNTHNPERTEAAFYEAIKRFGQHHPVVTQIALWGGATLTSVLATFSGIKVASAVECTIS
ncbi:hypothetical protein CERZMDRAFT_101759 [Cercospora zeae-maydis SCOH1-5]|uniref:Uncharacterized protein n=1 Tax=Cercospora zeae-maydis SCOH1-5 TaxID=717836 RepID=A0A6A6F2N9_9PEZI|nr:hypothetical protein CERZMDRAFT_101759 [Cercospora zeae-maydis SCOH1-5]